MYHVTVLMGGNGVGAVRRASKYNFKAIIPVPTSKDFVDVILSKTQRKTPTIVHKGTHLFHALTPEHARASLPSARMPFVF